MKLLSRLISDTESRNLPDDRLLTGWGRTAPSRATVYHPSSIDELASIIREPHRRGLIARGLGRSYGDPAQNAGGSVIDLTAMQSIHEIDLEAATVTVDAGISLHRMMQLFVPLGLFVPVTPGTRYVTVGGAIASDIHGKNHHVDGTFGNHVLRFKLLTSSGNVIDVERTSQPDLFDATCGGMGLTGFILTATIRMIRIETSMVLVDTERIANIDRLLTKMVEDDMRYRYSVAWVDTLAQGKALGRGVLYQGNHQNVANSEGPPELEGPKRSRLSVPDLVPASIVGTMTARAFNEFWFRKHPRLERESPEPLSAFFHQLDMVENANRVYGSRGFVQHQCIVPDGREDALRWILELLSRDRVPTYLVVLKRMGEGNGLLSFPVAGWTLAVDIPTGWTGLSALLDTIDEIVLDAGGRLYFAKDSRMRPELVKPMYPDIPRWREIADRHDPDRRLASDLSRRLGLRGS
ncbi:MAG: FAD-binding oxidoreductase [Thermomicrobiales bacterium]